MLNITYKIFQNFALRLGPEQLNEKKAVLFQVQLFPCFVVDFILRALYLYKQICHLGD